MIDILKKIIPGFLSIVFLILIWETSNYLNWEYKNIFPPPSVFLTDLVNNDFKVGIGSQSSTILDSIWASFFRVFVGLIISFFAALVVGVLINYYELVKKILMPIINIFAPIAPIAWIPLALVLFGIGNSTAIFIVFMGVFFIFTISVVKIIDNVPESFKNISRTLGATEFQVWTKVILPYIIPHIFLVLRINFIAAWMAVLVSEMTGLKDGLGAILITGRNLFDNNLILLGMSLIAVVGSIIDVLLRVTQKRFFWWDNINDK